MHTQCVILINHDLSLLQSQNKFPGMYSENHYLTHTCCNISPTIILTVAYLHVTAECVYFWVTTKHVSGFRESMAPVKLNVLFLQYLCSWSELLWALSESCNRSGCHLHLISCVAGWVQQNCTHFGQHLLSELKGKGVLSSQYTSPETEGGLANITILPPSLRPSDPGSPQCSAYQKLRWKSVQEPHRWADPAALTDPLCLPM